jgi:hypothetical protein
VEVYIACNILNSAFSASASGKRKCIALSPFFPLFPFYLALSLFYHTGTTLFHLRALV